MKIEQFCDRYVIDKDDPTIAGQLGKRYTRLRERGGSIKNVSKTPNGGFMREFPMNWKVSFDPKDRFGQTVTIVVKNVAGNRNAIAAALKKLTPEQRKAVKTESGRAYTF